jgi:putative membrane protein
MELKTALEPWVAMANTSMILVSGVFLIIGYVLIRNRALAYDRRMTLHKRCMLTATGFAGAFLVVYVTRYLIYDNKIFAGEGWVRTVYLVILVSHVILATAIVPFVLVTLRRALRGDYASHRAVARVTFPMWLYVVVTGWIVFWMLHSL